MGKGFIIDKEVLKPGLILFCRADVEHKNWYCRIAVKETDRYKTISLKTPDINEARIKAFDNDADIRFRLQYGIPVFEKSFAEIATEYANLVKTKADAGLFTKQRWQTVEGHIRLHLIPYIGNIQIIHVNKEKWDGYHLWRKSHGKGINGRATDGSIRDEMKTFRAVMRYAADRQHSQKASVIEINTFHDQFNPPLEFCLGVGLRFNTRFHFCWHTTKDTFAEWRLSGLKLAYPFLHRNPAK